MNNKSWQCQRCGENIGWFGRFNEWIGFHIHNCDKTDLKYLNMDTKFTIEHDDHIPSIIQEISEKLKPFGLKIILVDYGDGYETHAIIITNEL